MEASRFGFGDGVSSGYKFDPTDADIVASYLLPRALGLRHPYEHAIIDDDPASLPPWELLHNNGHADSQHAFFFGPGSDMTGGRKNRTVKAGGGTWRGQKGVDETLTLLSPDGREMDIKYKRYNLTYYRTNDSGTSGWVMHEYEIISPPLPRTVLSRIRFTDRGKADMQRQQAQAEVLPAGADQQVFPDPDQPGPSHQYHAGHVAGNAFVMGDGQGFSGAQTDVAHGDNGGDMGETPGYFTSSHYAGEGRR